jgi:general secretion pathway protein A
MKQQDILSFFSLEKHPFSKDIPVDQLLSMPSLNQAHEAVKLLIDTRGIGLLTGPSGSGKSTLLRKSASELNPGLYAPYYVSHTSLATAEFYQSLANTMGLSSEGRRVKVFKRIKDFLLHKNETGRVHPVIFIDEAHGLTADSLKELRTLMNFEYDSKHVCTILLCGHSELRNKLSLNVFTSLSNSITYTISLDALPMEETMSYLETRLTACGSTPGIITKNAMKLIHDASGGIIRSSGSLAWQSLIKAFQSKHPQVEKEHVQMVIAP